MKQGIHPAYGPVVFRDASADFAFLTRSTATSSRTVVWTDGKTYPVVDVETSSASHPFYTGTARVLDTAGRVEKFRRRYGSRGGAGTTGGTGTTSTAAGTAAGTDATAPGPAPTAEDRA
ncbi:large subunit ribosomal protein L31 [Cellulomonas cellasea]|uniref:Large ribosomal subunit protein bL31B n=1 Tax=Cellulomonas cellasea TaxID=43670 RepID=A0A7W4UG76_9CELL|nr:type B 50S ribosomal protein L31 [Cellulomonas cellasea]MBB2923593.1 large subunit ribosomal protein L31 [Cellulomonas cellasea]